MTTHRYRTRVVAVLDSHENGTVELSRDVISLNCNKTTKQPGSWQLQLVPRRNYLNLIHPNDVINIYIDPGDGKSGFVRTMMGFVDRVHRTERVGDNGEINTAFAVVGSDFQKAIDKTSMYFNNYMRQILDERFARSDQGRLRTSFRNDAEGSVLRNAGVTAYGTPADFVENFMMIILGFGQQWRLPDSYKRAREGINNNRDARRQRAKDRIPEVLMEAISKLGFDREALDDQLDDILTTARDTAAQPDVDAVSGGGQAANFAERREAARQLTNNPALLAYRNVLQTTPTDNSYPNGIIDLIDFDFIEALCIDGFQANAAVWQAGNQTLGQFIYGNSNGIVNELIFDLRPVSAGKDGAPDGGLYEGPYSRDDDELAINTDGTPQFRGTVAGVKYRPAIVFRESPYSTVDGIDLSSLVKIPEVDAISGGSAVETVGEELQDFIQFGPIFARRPNTPGRAIVKLKQALHPAAGKAFLKNAQARKHIDVVTIRDSDVRESALGRADHEVLNLFQLTPRASGDMSIQYRSVLTNFSPVVNQVSIARHGLRSWEGQSQFANYSRKNVVGVVGGSVDNGAIRRNLVRWSLLMDHWNQHNIEYLSGTITLRGMPEVRVGYRLDWVDRNESYYVDGVQHQWQYPGAMSTIVSVSRGQRNDPFPAYIPPVFINDSGQTEDQVSGNRGATGRLAKFFNVRSTHATLGSTEGEGPSEAEFGSNTTDQYPDVVINGGVAVLAHTEQIGVDPEYDAEDQVEIQLVNDADRSNRTV